jgi:hypothetical protein
MTMLRNRHPATEKSKPLTLRPQSTVRLSSGSSWRRSAHESCALILILMFNDKHKSSWFLPKVGNNAIHMSCFFLELNDSSCAWFGAFCPFPAGTRVALGRLRSRAPLFPGMWGMWGRTSGRIVPVSSSRLTKSAYRICHFCLPA